MYLEASLSATLKPGDRAPDFQLPVLDHQTRSRHLREELNHVSLRDLLILGPSLLVFVKESCPTCQYALPLVDRIYQNYPDSKSSIYVIAQEEGPVAGRMVESLNLQTPVLLDRAPYAVSEQYGLVFVPTLFYVNCDREIENIAESFEREELNTVNQKIAEFNGRSVLPVVKETEDVPAFRPG